MPRESLPYLICLLLSIAIFSCDKDRNSSIYGCCDHPWLRGELGNISFVTPNVFTPNGDGINDQLEFFCDSTILIRSLKIYNASGNLAYQTDSILADRYIHIWDGKTKGEVKEGIYTVSVFLEAPDGSTGNFNAKVCCNECLYPPPPEPLDCNNCLFGDQILANMYGWYTNYPIIECELCFQ